MSKKAKFKTPTTKQAAVTGKELLLGLVGALLGRGAEIFPITSNQMLDKAILAGTPLLAAMSYKGPMDREAMAIALGNAIYQGVKGVDGAIQKSMGAPIAGSGKHIEYLNRALGMAGYNCGCNNGLPMNGAPSIVWYDDYDAQEAEYREIGSTTYSPYRKAKGGINV